MSRFVWKPKIFSLPSKRRKETRKYSLWGSWNQIIHPLICQELVQYESRIKELNRILHTFQHNQTLLLCSCMLEPEAHSAGVAFTGRLHVIQSVKSNRHTGLIVEPGNESCTEPDRIKDPKKRDRGSSCGQCVTDPLWFTTCRASETVSSWGFLLTIAVWC